MFRALNKNWIYIILTVLLIGALLSGLNRKAYSANTPNRSLTLSDSRASQTSVDYRYNFDIVGSYSLGSIVFEVCQEDPIPDQPCTAPPGFNSSSVTIVSQTGESGFSISPASTNSRIVLFRPAQITINTTININLGNITNPSTNGTYFSRIYTKSSSDGSGPSIDNGGIAFAINSAINTEAEVPPFLYFCSGVSIAGLDCRNNNTSSGLLINFGEFSNNNTSTGTSQVMAATNARSGYNIYVSGETLTSGNNIIPALDTRSGSSQNVSQFGLNLRDNSSPDVGQEPTGPGVGFVMPDYNSPNSYKFKKGDAIARSNGTSNFRKFTVSYIVNINQDQRPGTYNTTLTYICLANF